MATSLPSMTSTYVYAFDQRISFTPASQLGEWQPGVRNYLAAAFPNITAPLIDGASDAITFNTGWDMTHTSRVCGGYYAPAGSQ